MMGKQRAIRTSENFEEENLQALLDENLAQTLKQLAEASNAVKFTIS